MVCHCTLITWKGILSSYILSHIQLACVLILNKYYEPGSRPSQISGCYINSTRLVITVILNSIDRITFLGHVSSVYCVPRAAGTTQPITESSTQHTLSDRKIKTYIYIHIAFTCLCNMTKGFVEEQIETYIFIMWAIYYFLNILNKFFMNVIYLSNYTHLSTPSPAQ